MSIYFLFILFLLTGDIKMAFFNWNDNMSVNIMLIDEQHKNLLSMINELYDAMKMGKGNDVLGNIINRLVDYTKEHFQTEEKLFVKYGYSLKDHHINEHKKFVQQVQEFKNGFETGKFGLSNKLLDFLKEWLKNHIMVTDKKYSQFFNQKGLV